MALAARLKTLREAHGLSANAASKAIGFSATMLSRIESGDDYPSRERIRALADLYGVPVVDLIAEEAIDRRRIDVPDGVSDDDLRAVVYRLAGQAKPEVEPSDPHAYLCPHCGRRITATP